jgi:hypothetical protein
VGGDVLNTTPRGATTYKKRAAQGRDFTGLRFGDITPTDIDGFIEYHNKCFVFYEAKHVTAPEMERGQRWAFERLCDALQEAKREAIYIIFEHNIPADKEIDFAVCEVRSYRYKGEWKYPTKTVTVKHMTDRFIERFGK